MIWLVSFPVLTSASPWYVIGPACQELSAVVNSDGTNLPPASGGAHTGTRGLKHRLFVARWRFEGRAKEQANDPADLLSDLMASSKRDICVSEFEGIANSLAKFLRAVLLIAIHQERYVLLVPSFAFAGHEAAKTTIS
jgi:hypothetical protein